MAAMLDASSSQSLQRLSIVSDSYFSKPIQRRGIHVMGIRVLVEKESQKSNIKQTMQSVVESFSPQHRRYPLLAPR